MNKMYSDGEYKLEIENLPVNRYGKARIFIGYAADELERTEKNQDSRLKEFLLVDWDMTGKDNLG